MPRIIKKLQIELNSAENLRDMLQEVTDLADEQILQVQKEIEKLKNSTDLTAEAMDGKSRYAKAVNDYLAIKDKAMAKKIEVARIMNDVLSHNGNLGDGEQETGGQSFNINTIQSMVDEMMSKDSSKSERKTISLKKP
jgi:hypothetical protein